MSELHFWTAFAFVLGIVAGVTMLALCNAAADGGSPLDGENQLGGNVE